MPVKMQPTNVIKAHLGLEPNGRIQNYFTSECAKKMDKYVPMREGHLRQYKIEGNFIIYDQPYARYQYYGIRDNGTHQVTHYTTPGTGPYWDERMKTADLPDIVSKIQEKFGGK